MQVDNNIQTISANQRTTDEIEASLNSWYNTILEAMKQHIPMKHHKTIIKPVTNPTIKQLQWTIKQYLRGAEIFALKPCCAEGSKF